MEKPTIEELREFSKLPWIRCSCGKVTSRLQERYDKILAEKEKDYYDNLLPIYESLIEQGFEELFAQQIADKQAQVITNANFNKKVTKELGLTRYCCFNTLQSPIILPLGSGVDLDPNVDVGERLSKLQIKEAAPVLPTAQGEIQATPRKARVYIAR